MGIVQGPEKNTPEIRAISSELKFFISELFLNSVELIFLISELIFCVSVASFLGQPMQIAHFPQENLLNKLVITEDRHTVITKPANQSHQAPRKKDFAMKPPKKPRLFHKKGAENKKLHENIGRFDNSS